MTDQTNTGAEAPFDVDSAVEALSQPPDPEPGTQEDSTEEVDTSEAEEPGPQADADEGGPDEEQATAEEDPAEEEVTGDEGEGGEGEDPDEEPSPAIEAPKSWKAEAREEFAKLPRETQQYIVERESERDRAVSKAQQEAADAKKKAEAASEQESAWLKEHAPRIQEQFRSKWEKLDWHRAANELEPQEYNKLRAQFEADRQAAAEVHHKHQQQQQEAQRKFLEDEARKLAELHPDFADETKAGKVKEDIAEYARKTYGVSDDELGGVNAVAVDVLRKAMLYDRAQDAAKRVEKKTPPKTARPTQPKTSRDKNEARRKSLLNRVNSSSRSDAIDAAVDLLSS